jgi:hypothetical protein
MDMNISEEIAGLIFKGRTVIPKMEAAGFSETWRAYQTTVQQFS